MADELGLAALAIQGRDREPRRPRRRSLAIVAPHQMQAHVDPSGGAGGGDDLALVDEQYARVDPDPWIAARQFRGG